MEDPLFGRSSLRLSLSRRRVFALGAIGLTVGLAGCRSETPAAPIPLEPDELAVNRAVDAARALRTDALTLAESRPPLAGLLRRVAAVHEEHLAALGSPIATAGATGSATPASGSASGSAEPTTTASPTPAPTPILLIKAEVAAARTALRDGEAAAPAFAVLLCRIAAARVVNADLLSVTVGGKPSGVLRPAPAATPSSASTATPAGPTASADPTSGDSTSGDSASADDPVTTDPNALQTDSSDPTDLIDPGTPAQIALDRLVAGEHAAVFAYPLIIARAAANRRALASTLWQAHQIERDDFVAQLQRSGVQATAAEPAYDVGTLPATAAKATALAARVERGLAALATDLLAAGTATDDDRVLGADQLVLAARRTANWTGKPSAFPGLTGAASAASPTPDPAPSP